MQFNITKCKATHIGHNNLWQDYEMMNKILDEVELERDLGVFINVNLKFSRLCLETFKKANKIKPQISRNFGLKTNILRVTYNQLWYAASRICGAVLVKY